MMLRLVWDCFMFMYFSIALLGAMVSGYAVNIAFCLLMLGFILWYSDLEDYNAKV